ncbi:MAG: hypothetical protein HXX15_00015 [Rhodopseudomonas sp.]|uniref:hypothetical protein n=1 Tax=Rhodopseudomonas sp. TaxID=1078 RepID=UPI00182E72D1|nr:hypothetical protein [Rhodopseudomonas sp.]NVN84446.1 hypothetical protein [Rhodopseudomonas sp.]
MTDLDHDNPQSTKWHFGLGSFVLREWPYLSMLVLALFGVAYTSFSQTSVYWIILTPFIGLVCVITRWREVEGREEHLHLIVSQILHWGAVLIAMDLMSLEVTRTVSGVAAALGVLTLLALGTFTAGLHIRAWKVGVVGVILGASVPAIALLEQSALFILLIVVVLVAIAVPFVWHKKRSPVGPSHPLYEPPASRSVPEPPPYQPPVADPVTPSAKVVEDPEPKPEPDRSDADRPADNVRNISGAP